MVPHVFGVPIEGGSWTQIKQGIEAALARGRAFWIVTANPEILLEAERDTAYAESLRQADWRTVDGVGLAMVLRARGVKEMTRYPGVQLAEDVIEEAAVRGWRVAFVGGGDPATAADAVRVWTARYPALAMHAEHGGKVAKDGQDDDAGEEARHRLSLFAPEVLFAAFGHPKQERWIQRFLHEFPTVKVVVGVGGTFDFWTGRAQRAPRVMQRLGLEWVWRVIQEPARVPRILRAVILFPLHAWWNKKTLSA